MKGLKYMLLKTQLSIIVPAKGPRFEFVDHSC